MKHVSLALSLCCVVSVVLAGSAYAQVSFFQPPAFSGTGKVFVADFNGDGKPDILTSDGTMNLGNGDGTFTPGTSIPGTSTINPVLAVADFNGDGRPDVLEQGSGTLLVLLGNGDGSFQAPISSPLVQGLGSVAAVDLNGDGKADVVGMCCSGGVTYGSTLFVYISKGDGTFSPAVQYNLGFVPQYPGASLTVGDFNGDGKIDAAVSASGSTQAGEEIVFLGNGDGTFQTTPKISPTLWAVYNAVSGDFNGNGNLDLGLVGCKNTTSCTTSTFILAGNGDGTFQAPVAAIANIAFYSPLVAADLNGDGKLDLVVGSVYGPMGIYLGNGDGTFSDTANYLGAAAAIADFNGDGKLDLAVGGGSVGGELAQKDAVLLGNGDGTFQGLPDAPLPFSIGPAILGANEAVVGDFEKSGFPDVAVVWQSSIYIFHNHAGALSLSHTYTISQPQAGPIATGDFNGDGNLDLIVPGIINSLSGTWGFNALLGNGDGSFQSPVFYQQSIPAPGPSTSPIVVADFNNDKKLDFAIMSGGGFAVFLGNGDGTFGAALATSVLNGGIAGSADFNGDGKLDIAAGTGILFGNGDGTFQAEVSIPNWGGTQFIADVNNDGKPDLVGYSGVELGNGDGTFTLVPNSQSNNAALSAVADVNGDGKVDELIWETQLLDQPGPTGFLLGNGDGTFGSLIRVPTNGILPISTFWPSQSTIAFLVDMNGDGRPDLVFAPDGIAVTLNTTAPNFEVLASALSPSTVIAGNSATSTVTVSPTFGFNQTVTLTCSGLPSGASCAFSPATIANSSGTSTLTITTSSSVTPGTYSVQVQGSAGSTVNSVPVSLVIQAPAGFEVSAGTLSPSPVTPGGSATSTVAISSISGFSQTVVLTCSGLPSGASCAFNPGSIADSSGTSVLTISTNASLVAGSYAVEVQGTSGSILNTVAVSLVVEAPPDFNVGAASGSPTSQSVSDGQTASFSLAFAGTGSFSGTVNLSCAITPVVTPAPTCSVPSTVQISGTGTQTVTVKVGTTAPVSGITVPHATFPSGPLPLVWAPMWALVFLGSMGFWVRNRKRMPLVAAPIVALAFAFSVGCGGSSSHTTPGTPAGTYTATVTATSGSTSHRLPLQVIVQ